MDYILKKKSNLKIWRTEFGRSRNDRSFEIMWSPKKMVEPLELEVHWCMTICTIELVTLCPLYVIKLFQKNPRIFVRKFTVNISIKENRSNNFHNRYQPPNTNLVTYPDHASSVNYEMERLSRLNLRWSWNHWQHWNLFSQYSSFCGCPIVAWYELCTPIIWILCRCLTCIIRFASLLI